MRKVIYLFNLLPMVIFAKPAFAACDATGTFDECTKVSPPPGSTITSEAGLVGQVLSEVLPLVLVIAGFMTVVFIVISGLQFITSNGNPESAAGARSRLVYALIGFIVIVLSFAVLQFVNNLFLKTTIV